MTDTQATILAAVIGLVGGAIGIIGTYIGSVKLTRINNKSLAGMKLREAFAPELARLQTQGSSLLHESSDMLELAFEKHQMAINEFKFFLTGDKLACFNKAWEEYYKDPTGGDKPYFSQYMALSKEDIQRAIDRIKAILEFTKYK